MFFLTYGRCVFYSNSSMHGSKRDCLVGWVRTPWKNQFHVHVVHGKITIKIYLTPPPIPLQTQLSLPLDFFLWIRAIVVFVPFSASCDYNINTPRINLDYCSIRPTVMSVGYRAIIKPVAFLLIIRIHAGKIVACSRYLYL